jgi:integrase/recombinase XerD
MKIIVSKINYKGSDRIRIEMPYNAEITGIIKQIPDAKWSMTLQSWTIPCTKEAYLQLKHFFSDEVLIVNDPFLQQDGAIIPEKIVSTINKNVSIEVAGRRIFLKMPKNNTDVQFIRSFRYAYWDANAFVWIIPHYKNNLDLLKDYFGERLESVNILSNFEVQSSQSEKRILEKDSVLLIKTNSGRLRVVFGYNPLVAQAIKSIPYSKWDAKNKWWSVPYSEKILEGIKTTAIAQQLTVTYEEESQDVIRSPRVTPFDVPNYRSCPEQYVLKMKELRYSEHAIQTYIMNGYLGANVKSI